MQLTYPPGSGGGGASTSYVDAGDAANSAETTAEETARKAALQTLRDELIAAGVLDAYFTTEDTRTVGAWLASETDSEQDNVLPNLAKNPVLGPLMPGSTHGLYFGKKGSEDALLVDCTSVACYVRSLIGAPTSTSEFSFEGEAIQVPPSSGYAALFYHSDNVFLRVTSTGGLIYTDDGGNSSTSTAVTTLLSISDGEKFWWRAHKNGTQIDVDVSSDGSTWVSAISQTTGSHTLGSGYLYVGYPSTGYPPKGWRFSLTQRDGDLSAPVLAHWTPDLHPAGSRADTDTAQDALGNTWTITRPSTADSNDPTRVAYGGTKKLYLPGTSGNYASVPDSAANSITGDLDLRFFGTPDDYTPASNMPLVAKYSSASGDRGFILMVLTSGSLYFAFTQDGSTVQSVSSTAAWTSGDARVTFDVDDGAGNGVIKFWTSVDGGDSWSQLGSDKAITGTSTLHDSSLDLIAGGYVGASVNFTGEFERAEIRDGIDGPIASRISAADAADGSATSWTDSVTGETVTVHRGSSGQVTAIVTEDVVLTNTSTYLECLYDPALTVGSGESLTAILVERHWIHGDFWKVLDFSDAVSSDGWRLEAQGSGFKGLYCRLDDGTTIEWVGQTGTDTYTLGDREVFSVSVLPGDSKAWVDGSGIHTVTTTFSTVDPGSDTDVQIAHSNTGGAGTPLEFFALIILKDTARLTDAEASTAYDQLKVA